MKPAKTETPIPATSFYDLYACFNASKLQTDRNETGIQLRCWREKRKEILFAKAINKTMLQVVIIKGLSKEFKPNIKIFFSIWFMSCILISNQLHSAHQNFIFNFEFYVCSIYNKWCKIFLRLSTRPMHKLRHKNYSAFARYVYWSCLS